MEINEIKKRLIELVEELTDDKLEGDVFTTPLNELGVDSLMALELAVHLEREYGIRLTEEELTAIQTLNDILNIVNDKEEN
jgi:acyl carrier protein